MLLETPRPASRTFLLLQSVGGLWHLCLPRFTLDNAASRGQSAVPVGRSSWPHVGSAYDEIRSGASRSCRSASAAGAAACRPCRRRSTVRRRPHRPTNAGETPAHREGPHCAWRLWSRDAGAAQADARPGREAAAPAGVGGVGSRDGAPWTSQGLASISASSSAVAISPASHRAREYRSAFRSL